MVKIPTLIPEHLGDRLTEFAAGGVGLTVYRIIVAAIALTLFGSLVLTGSSYLVVFLVTSLIAAVWFDDVKQILVDIWNANFWVLRT